MSSGLMDTEAGGESGQYEGNLHTADPQSKSTGQLGDASTHTTTDPSDTPEGKEQASARGEKTAENIRYGQGISETGGGTEGLEGEAEQSGFGGDVGESSGEGSTAEGSREAQGYGGEKDVSQEIGG
ncbi:hypothetical protein LTR53_005596 [Teratosphaeriaceae sp. CCFEE 6253]|nr:hypothetical protein LTR53_005596 [Teratosphaeriaceae sp. CCFEE 6253]